MPPKPKFCPRGYRQSEEKGGSLSARNSCLYCGRTKDAHEKDEREEQILPADIVASEWLELAGYKNAPYFELARVILTRYVEHERSQVE